MKNFPELCPICTHHCENWLDEQMDVVYYRCGECGYIYKSPHNHPNLSDQKSRYDLHQNNSDDPGYRAYFDRFLDWVLPLVGEGGLALDYGCGVSDLLSVMLGERGFAADRYDPIYYPDESYRARRYDLIVSTEVFEHLDTPLSAMKSLSGLLYDNGYVAIQTQFYPPKYEEFGRWYYRMDPTHIGFFSVDTLRYMARSCGLEYVSDDGVNKILLRKHM